MIGFQAAFVQQLLNVPQRQRISKIPADRTENERRFCLPPLEDRQSRSHFTILSRCQPVGLRKLQHNRSGLEVLKAIKSTPELMHIPVVVAAGSDDPNFVRAVYALNGNCFIRKPGELQEFVRFIESCYEFWSRVVTLCPQPQKKVKKTA